MQTASVKFLVVSNIIAKKMSNRDFPKQQHHFPNHVFKCRENVSRISATSSDIVSQPEWNKGSPEILKNKIVGAGFKPAPTRAPPHICMEALAEQEL